MQLALISVFAGLVVLTRMRYYKDDRMAVVRFFGGKVI